jgi:hypothetical protein
MKLCFISSQLKLSYDNIGDVANVDFNVKCKKVNNKDDTTKVSLEEDSEGGFLLLFMILCFTTHLPLLPSMGALQCWAVLKNQMKITSIFKLIFTLNLVGYHFFSHRG